jgi:hypothetical protein
MTRSTALTTTNFTRPSDSAALPQAIFRHWIHSREEDTAGILVYRPEGFPFPPTFGRDGFELTPSGRFILEEAGPADGIVTTIGRWTFLGERRIAVSFPGTTKAVFTFEIVDLDESVLRIRRATCNGSTTTPVLDEAQLADHRALPPPASFRLISYDRAEVLTLESNPPQYVLQVSGLKPSASMKVSLMPLVYVRQPEYWEIEVVGGLYSPAIPVKTPYTVSLPLGGTLGSRGIQVIGANRSDTFEVPPGQEPNDR